MVTDSTSPTPQTVGEQRYYPYGETRFTSGTINTDKLFTGQRDMGLGIYHYGARFYSPKLGRFLSADTIVPGAANPQAYNRYSYVLGNPLKYIDPTGHYCVGDDEDCADEAGYGPAPSGNGGVNTGGGGGGGNPHDDDDFDPNPNNYPGSPECYPGELVCYVQQGGYVDSAAETWASNFEYLGEYIEDNLALSWSAATQWFDSPIGGFGQFIDPALCQNCGQQIDFRIMIVTLVLRVLKDAGDSWRSRPTPPLFRPSPTPVPTATITPHYTPTVTFTPTSSATPWPTLTPTLTLTPTSTPTSPYITPTYSPRP